jgi:hypothetical protein
MLRVLIPFCLALLACAARADDLPAPQGEVLLTVRGAITATNAGDAALFDRAMLEALPAETFATSTIWTEGVRRFTGIPLATLLEAVGAEGRTLRAVALNDYAVEIPVSDAVAGGPVVAYAMDGAAMSVRDKGPLWIVYPYDADAVWRTEVIYARSIWQLSEVEVLP